LSQRHEPLDYLFKHDEQVATLYADLDQLRDPLVSPFFATQSDLVGLPPMLLQCGGSETLHDENVDFVEHAKKAGAQAILQSKKISL
jgi:acetyl esterase/lipase